MGGFSNGNSHGAMVTTRVLFYTYGGRERRGRGARGRKSVKFNARTAGEILACEPDSTRRTTGKRGERCNDTRDTLFCRAALFISNCPRAPTPVAAIVHRETRGKKPEESSCRKKPQTGGEREILRSLEGLCSYCVNKGKEASSIFTMRQISRIFRLVRLVDTD